MSARDDLAELIESATETVLAESGVDFWRECDVVPDIRAAILAALRAAPEDVRLALARELVPETHAVVPVEPTKAMADCGGVLVFQPGQQWAKCARDIYRAMLAAAQDGEPGR